MERATQTILFLVLFTHFGAAQNAAKTGGDEFSVAVGVILRDRNWRPEGW